MYESLGSKFFSTTTGIRSEPETFDLNQDWLSFNLRSYRHTMQFKISFRMEIKFQKGRQSLPVVKIHQRFITFNILYPECNFQKTKTNKI